MRTVTTLVVAGVLATAALVAGQSRLTPETYKLVGTLGPPAKGHSSYRALDLEDDGRRYQLQVDELYVIRGERLGAQILDDLSQYRPALYLEGPAEVLKPLRDAEPGAKVELTGYRPSGTRRFMVSAVTATPANP